MDLLNLNKTAATIAAVVPQVTDAIDRAESAVAGIATGLEGSVKDSLQIALSGIADGVSQLVGIALRVDGAMVQLDGVEIVIRNPKLTINLGPYKAE